MGREPFADYYEILQVSPNADQETIDRVYRLLARRYHPDNPRTGDAARFDILARAYHVLSDSRRRATFHAKYESSREERWNGFFQASSAESFNRDRKIYKVILSSLYLARRRNPLKAGVGILELEKLLGLDEKELEFYFWYLREKGWIQRLDGGKFAITVKGVEAVIQDDFVFKRNRFLPPDDEESMQDETATAPDNGGRRTDREIGESEIEVEHNPLD